MKKYNIPIFIPHEGCPNDCIFCNQRKITGLATSMTPEDAATQIATQLSYLPTTNRTVEVAFFGGSFTGLPLGLQEEFYRVADSFRPQIDGIRLSTRPDYIRPETLALATRWGVTTIELGAQSAVDSVLAKNNRGHTFAQTVAASNAIHDAGIALGLQMMTGMYGSSKAEDLQTATALVKLKPDCVRIYPVLVLKETALAKLYLQGEYQPQTLETAVQTAKDVLQLFRQAQIPVIRMGLHAGEDLREEGAVLAGPFHPAFGELVESRLWRDRMEEELKQYPEMPKVWELSVPKGEVSKAIGHQRCNAKYFLKEYGIQLKIKD